MDTPHYSESELTSESGVGRSPEPNVDLGYNDISPQNVSELFVTPNTGSRPAQSAPATLQTTPFDAISAAFLESASPPVHLLPGPDEEPPSRQNGAAKTVTFAGTPQYFQATKAAQRRGLDLKARLYDRPQDAQVYQTIRPAGMQSKKIQNGVIGTSNVPVVPRPPPSRVPAPGGALRTTLFKRDHARIRMKRQGSKSSLLEEETKQQKQDRLGSEPAASRDTEPKSTTGQATPDEIQFLDVHKPTAQHSLTDKHPVATGMSVAPTSPLMQLTKKEFTPDPSVTSDTGDPPSPPSSPSGSRKQDPKLVFMYLKTNKFDDTPPEIDSLTYHLRRMRNAMELVVDLPRHGPTVKEEMIGIEDRLLEPAKHSIEAQLKSKQKHLFGRPEDPGEFVYALPRDRRNPRGRYNPYSLQVVSPQEARTSRMYFTASATAVTVCIQESEDEEYEELTPTMQWLYERRLFHAIFDLPVFVKFRIWKAFKMWKSNVRALKKSSSKTVMHQQLFTANEILQRCLLHIRSQCEAACSSLSGEGDEDKAVTLLQLDSRCTLTLEEFCVAQAQQCDVALLKLMHMRDKIVRLAFECCAKVAEMEGVTQTLLPNSGPLTKKVDPSKNKSNAAAKKTGDKQKKTGPSYTDMAEWRSILARLSCFLRAADYLILEMLHRLVKTAVRALKGFLSTSVSTGQDLAKKDEDSDEEDGEGFVLRKRTTGFSRRLGMLTDSEDESRPASAAEDKTVHYDFDKQEEEVAPIDIDQVLEDIKQQEFVEMPPEPVFEVQLVLNVPELKRASSKTTSNSRKSSHSRASRSISKSMSSLKKKMVTFPDQEPLTSSSESETDSSDESDADEFGAGNTDNEDVEVKTERFDEESMYAYPERTPRTEKKDDTCKVFVSLAPNETQFMSKIRGIIAGLEHTVGQFGALQRDPYLSVFWCPPRYDLKLSMPVQEEDDTKRPWPDLELLFGEDPEYRTMVQDVLRLVGENVGNVMEYSKNFEQYCEMVHAARQVDVEHSMSKHVWTPEEFHHVLSTHTEMIRSMTGMEVQRRRGMVTVLGENFKQACFPYPNEVLEAIRARLPVIANERNENLIKVIKGASKKLDHPPQSVEEFVEHLAFLSHTASELSKLDEEYNVVTRLFTIARNFNMPIQPEELALYQTLMPSFTHLKTVIIYCEAKKDENISKFSDDLNTHIQALQAETYDIRNLVQEPTLLSSDTLPVVALENLKLLQDSLSTLTIKARSYASYQDRFGSSISRQSKLKGIADEALISDYSDSGVSAQQVLNDLSEVERDLQLRRLLWESTEEWSRLVDEWTASQFDKLNVDVVQKNVNRFTQTVYMLEKGLPPNEVLPRLKERVIDFKQGMPIMTALRNPALRPRHWQEIQDLIGRHIVRDKNFTLGKFMDLQLFQYKDKINDISTQASNEATLEIMLNKVIDLWQSTDFRLIPHSNRDFMIIAGADDITQQLEESQVTIATIRGSRFVSPIKALVEEWDRKLNVFSRTLDEWMNCQRNWLYLEQIFLAPDIQRQLPSEAKLFAAVDKSWKDIMRRTEDRPNALRAAVAPGVLEILQTNNSNLEKIHKCLEDYLETKRLVFPRFYFLSNDELLDILAQSKNPDAVQPHLVKCFGNIKSLEIVREPKLPPTVRTMISAEGEIILMPKNVRARGPVEQWLGSVESAMFDTVKRCMKFAMMDRRLQSAWPDRGAYSLENFKECVHRWGRNLQDWVLSHPGQVVLTVVQIMFNRDVVASLESTNSGSSLIETRDKLVFRLNTLAGMVTKPLSSYQRHSVEALITIVVHARDILNRLIEEKVRRSDDFDWTRQLRYEWDEQHNTCMVQQANASFQYGYEYLGCSSRLVITPLTDRCYLTLTGALYLHLGGSPAGPAGTGKTETVKDLAKAVGKQCLVFNCSEGLDYKMMGKFFSGQAQSGSWCCFDEFNRIDLEVLSVIAQQLHSIKTAKDQNALRFVFEGRDIRLNSTCGVFITMNPGYAGRVELPDNLKSLFRPVSMMVPDYALIAEIMLFSEGFTSAKSLSNKIVNLYQLASKQLSQQDHYDFGMRAIKSVLVMAGQKKRQMQSEQQHVALSEEQEAFILIHSLRDANLPKFLAEDVPLFESILADLFPGISPPAPDSGALEKAISMAIRDLGLQHWPGQIDKVKQLHSQILVRHGVMLVGPTGGGKSAVRTILQRALVLLPTIHIGEADQSGLQIIKTYGKKGRVETFAINPKCVKMGELYGQTNPNTLEWTDGLLASAVRRFAKEAAEISQGGEDQDRSTTMGSVTPRGERPSSQLTTPRTPQSLAADSHNPQDSGLADEHKLLEESSDRTPAGQGGDEIPQDWQWLVLDGPVDTLWVENLNTVLDDSRLLCLANGERVGLTPGMRLLFEVDNLSQASPATISRCAMVYLDPVDLGWRPYVRTWLSKLPRDIPESGKRHLHELFEKSVDKGLEFMRLYSAYQIVAATDMSIVAMLCHLLHAFLDFLGKNGGYGNPDEERPASADSSGRPASRSNGRRGSRREEKKKEKEKEKERKEKLRQQSKHSSKEWYLVKYPDQLLTLLGKIFVFCYTWSVGGNLKREDDSEDDGGISVAPRMPGGGGGAKGKKVEVPDLNIAYEFDTFVHDMFDTEPPLGVRLPSGSRTIFHYFVSAESGKFVPWDELVPSTKSLIDKGVSHVSLGEQMGLTTQMSKKATREDNELVPTVDTVRYSFLAGLLLVNRHPVLLTGDSGVGKSAIINHMLKLLSKEKGATTQLGTILGDVFHYSERGTNILSNISALTAGILGEDDGDSGLGVADTMDLTFITGQVRRPTSGMVATTLQLSAQTTAARVRAQIEHKLIKKGRDTMVGPRGKKVLVFVDDLNLPAPEAYGAQPPLELLRQFLEFGGFYDTKKLVWKNIMDVTLCGACAPMGGGRNPVSPRLLKHFCMMALPQPSVRSLQHIYQVQLGRFLENQNFLPEIRELLTPLVSASIAVYYKMCVNMLPTPAKSHYTFNLRDLSKVIQGLLQADETVITSTDSAALLLAHEATRVFHDRLVDEPDRIRFFEFLADDLHNYFKVKWTPEKLHDEPILFGDFLDLNAPSVDRVYRHISDYDKLAQILEEYMVRVDYGSGQGSQLIFFKEALEHIVRAARVFNQPGGHMVLVGLDGTGKATTAQLASHVSGCVLYRLTLTRGYGQADFRDDLKKVFHIAGVQDSNTVFLLTDSDIIKETFLEDINCVLNSGEVPDLFDNDDLDSITMDMKRAAAEAEIPDTREAVYQFFIQRVRSRLHVVLATSPAGDAFRQRCRTHPSLVNCCTLDWFDEWSDEAMLRVAHVYLGQVDFQGISGDQDSSSLKDNIAHVCVNIHKDITQQTVKYYEEMRRRFYITPSSYLDLIKLYSNMLREQKQRVMDSKNRLFIGLSKLSEANSLVDAMQEELVNLGPKIEEKARDTELLLEQLSKDQEAVDQVRFIVEQEEATMQRETQIVQDYADQAQQDLQSVMPALQDAIAALDSLDKSDISEIRVYTNPPILVKQVMAAVCVLLRHKPEWSTSKHLLADPSFLKRLVMFDKNSVPDKVYGLLKKYTSMPDFIPEKVGEVSLACKSICQWVLALQHYGEVCKMVKPKQKRVEEAKEALSLAQESLQEKQASLFKIQEHLRLLQQQYDDSVAQRESLRERKALTTLRLKRASVLITALAGEKIRWEDSMVDLESKLKGVVGDTLVSAASIAYLAVFTAPYRKAMIQKWWTACKEKEIPVSEGYTLIGAMTEPNTVRKWQTEGLPQDGHSTENAIFVKMGHRWPLMIDPQGQAHKWICEMEGSALKKVEASDPNYMRTLETSIRVGEPVLLENVTEVLDPGLRPILMKEITRKGGQDVIRIGDTEIEYNQHFRLYMTTTMPNPHYLPAVCIKVILINFTVTFDGLQDQLLSTVVQQEQPILEQQRGELLESIARDLTMLRDLEDKSLSLLQKSEGHILDDQDLVDTLDKSKRMSEEIQKRVEESEETQQKIDLARKKYLPVATRGAVLYFVLADLAGIDVMYQFSLPWFQDMFRTCINLAHHNPSDSRPSSGGGSSKPLSGRIRPSSARNSPDLVKGGPAGRDSPLPVAVNRSMLKGQELTKHLMKMVDYLTGSIYRVVSKALFAHHQLVFSFMLCTSIMRSNAHVTDSAGPPDGLTQMGCISLKEWQVFLQGGVLAASMDPEVLERHDGLTPMQRLEAANRASSATSRIASAASHRSSVSASSVDSRPSQTGGHTSVPPKWIPEKAWRQCQYLSATLGAFSGLCMYVLNCVDQWQAFAKAEDPYRLIASKFQSEHQVRGPVPPDANRSLGNPFNWEVLQPFQRLILISVLRPDALVSSIRMFVEDLMGAKFLSAGGFDMKEVFDESSAKHPLIFILSPGVDPTAELMRFAREQRGSTLHVDMISLGRGQGPKAEELIAKAQILKGRWVFLQNCHLAASFMPRLQAIVEGFSKPNADIDPQFRLWLSSKPDPCFPVSILQTGMKMTVESPQGLKANLLRSLSSTVSEDLWDSTSPGPAWRDLLFGLCFFNAVINERRKYGALGWNIIYEFSASDLEVSIQVLQLLLTTHQDPPWEALRYLTGEVAYGGRVTDSWDRRCLISILNSFYCPEALQPSYGYSPDKVYHPLPSSFSITESRQYIEGLPDTDSPEVFGMHSNAEKAHRESQTKRLMDTVLSVQPRLTAQMIGTGKSDDEIVLELAVDIQHQLSVSIQGDEDKDKESKETGQRARANTQGMFPGLGYGMSTTGFGTGKKTAAVKVVQEDPFNQDPETPSALLTVLRQEMDRFNRLLSIIHTSLAALCLAIKGEVVMSETLEEMYKALLQHRVPKTWQQAAYESCKPLGSWVADLQRRVDFFSKWSDLVSEAKERKAKGQNQQTAEPADLDALREQPRSFWLPGFFFPQGFLTAVLQNHARKEGVSVDSLTFDFKVMAGVEDTEETLSNVEEPINVREVAFKGPSPPADGVLVFGLFLDGARFDPATYMLQDSRPEERFCRLPEVHFIPVQASPEGVAPPSVSSAAPTPNPTQAEGVPAWTGGMYECPLYRTSQRAGTLSSTGHSTNFVTAIHLPTSLPADLWITRGVALLCQLDD
ncbi:dynein heavy chain 6, axonemal-like isoform X2 [Acanthaster planci]|uniref:Dynein heavy chain 6, axonemal-like isoform X2 n=1 Tax=Acanthaster planci TaxID=133434 RepID=A0A8B7YBV9_ACAPL|nr:dynein heavy chain 6, axonemal-like isoform X2 [Acanthaster planci]